MCVYVWTIVRKRGGDAKTPLGSFVERAPYYMFSLYVCCYIDVYTYTYIHLYAHIYTHLFMT